MEPRTILKTAERIGLDAIAVTDHNTIVGGVKTLRLNEKHSIMVIVGAEIATNIGDIIGLFLNEEIKSRSILDVIDEIRSQAGLILIPHPFKGHKMRDIQSLISRIDLLEGCNSRHSISSEQITLLKTMNKPLVAGSDAHFPQEIGLCQNKLNRQITCLDEIRKELLSESFILKGNNGFAYYEPCSQIIKSIKSRNVKMFGWAFMNLIRSQIYDHNE